MLIGARSASRVALLVCLGIAAVRGVCIYFDSPPYATGVYYLRLWFRLDSLLAGCLVSLYREDRRFNFPHLKLWHLAVALVVSSVATEHPFLRPIGMTIQVLLAALVINTLIRHEDSGTPLGFLNSRALRG